MIKVFTVPSALKELAALRASIAENWHLLGIRRHQLTGEWMLRCARKEWWETLDAERKQKVLMQ